MYKRGKSNELRESACTNNTAAAADADTSAAIYNKNRRTPTLELQDTTQALKNEG